VRAEVETVDTRNAFISETTYKGRCLCLTPKTARKQKFSLEKGIRRQGQQDTQFRTACSFLGHGLSNLVI